MPLTRRENFLRNVTFRGPEWMPCHVGISDASWDQLREELEEVLVRHPTLFPGFEPGKRDYDNHVFAARHRAGEEHTDEWGCAWHSAINGLEGVVVRHPLEDWADLEGYTPPDPPAWGEEEREERIAEAQSRRERGEIVEGGTEHGFLLLRLTYLRGFENLMLDMATGEPRLHRLVSMLAQYNRSVVEMWLELGADLVNFAEDLGAQNSSIVGPHTFREWISPTYRELMGLCRSRGAHVGLHSDGYIMDLVDELIECGVTLLNPQDLCNGIDNLASAVKGRVCIRLDIDRQTIVPFGTRDEIHDLIAEETRKLGSPEGGLEMVVGIYPPTPPENVDALCEAFERYMTYWFE